MKRNFPLAGIVLMAALVILSASQVFAGQCAATTKKGTQCKRSAQAGSVYCWQHERMYGQSTSATKTETSSKTNTAPIKAPPTIEKSKTTSAVTNGRCQATTKKGTQCSRKAQAGSNYC